MDEVLIKRQIFEDVTRIVEELGISDEVSKYVDEIYDKIIDDSHSIESVLIDDGVGLKNNSFYMNDMYGNDLCVFYYIYNFKDAGFKQAFIKKEGTGYLEAGSRHIYKTIQNVRRLLINSISIPIESIGGVIQNVPTIKDSIQHELEHIYQQSKMGKEFGNEDLYKVVSFHLGNVNPYERNIAILLYMSFKSEIEGYANGLYAFVKNLDYSYVDKLNIAFMKSDAYKKLMQVYEARDFINEHINDIELDEALKKYRIYGIKKKDLNNIINNTISEMLTRFGKALIKAKKDKLAMGGHRGSLEKFEFKPY